MSYNSLCFQMLTYTTKTKPQHQTITQKFGWSVTST
jgi:hypothetical protein